MNKFNKKQIGTVVAALVLVVILYSLRTTSAHKKIVENSPEPVSRQFEMNTHIEQKKTSLEAIVLSTIKTAETSLDQGNNISSYKELSEIWLNSGNRLIAAHYALQYAENDKSLKNWIEAGELFYKANQELKSEEEKSYSLKNAVECYENALKTEPKNNDVRADLALCFVENPEEPMKGVKMLLEIVNENPDHLKANMNLGILSVRSGQYDKAINRFEKVLTIEKNNSEALINLIEVMELSGNIEKSKEYKMVYEELKKS